MQSLRVNGADMAYLEVGQGPPLVCVHGAPGDFRAWSAVLGPLSKKHHFARSRWSFWRREGEKP